MERQRGPEVDDRQGAVFRQDEQGGGHERLHDGGAVHCSSLLVRRAIRIVFLRLSQT